VLLTSFDTIEYWFQSQVIAGDLVIVRTSQLLLSALIKLFFIAYHFPLIAFVWLVTIEQIIKLVGMIGVYFRQHQSMVKWQFNLARGKGMLQDSWPLILTGVMVTIYQKIDQVMLEKMVSVESVGFYAAAVRFSEIWYFIPMAVCATVFPAIIRSKQRSEAEYYSRLQILYDSMAWISLSITIPITFSAVPLMTLLLGQEYSESGRILMLHIWAGPATFITVARTNWLMAENYTRFTFFPNLAGLIINISLNLLLIPRFSGVGAAIATLVAYSSTAFINPYHPRVNMNKMLLKAFLIPFRFQQNLNYYKQLMQMIKK
jgi:O-antigen/teichoic acid export membrane protein